MDPITAEQAQIVISEEWSRAENLVVTDIREGTGDVWHAWTEWTIEGESNKENVRLARDLRTNEIKIL